MKRTAWLLGIFLALCLAKLSGAATVQLANNECWTIAHDGVTVFQATGIADPQPPYSTVNYTGTCGAPPPDAGAYSTLAVTWVGSAGAHVIDVTQFANVFGRINFSAPIQPFWPGVSGTNVLWTDRGPQYVRLHAHMPANPGTLPHKIKGTSYGGTHGLTLHIAAVATGAPWPTGTADTACNKHAIALDDQSALYVIPIASTNPSYCQQLTDFDYLIDANGSGGVVSLTIN